VPTAKLTIEDTPRHFELWKAQFGRTYEGEEHAKRFEIYKANAAIVARHNSEGHSWTMALNQFADMTPKEFSDLQTLQPSTLGTNMTSATGRHVLSGVELPSSVDWRKEDLVNPIKNQGQCGSCWAFSTVVSFEGQVAKKTGKLESYSEQDLVDCVKDQTVPGSTQSCCDGCQGGLMDYGFAYMIAHQEGLDDLEEAYPYTAKNGVCSYKKSNAGSTPVTGYNDIKQGDEDSLKDACATVGPVSVAVNANTFWQLYSGGLFNPIFCDGNKLDHGVAVVGYGTDSGTDYWIVRNSWGESWGEEGYVRLVMGDNKCGIANSAVYPTV